MRPTLSGKVARRENGSPPSGPPAPSRSGVPLVALCLLAAAALGCGGGGEGDAPPGTTRDVPVVRLDAQGGGRGGTGTPSVGNRAPVLERIGDRRVVVGDTVAFALEAFDADGDPLSFAVFGNVPPTAKFDRTTGTFAWTPDREVPPVFLTFQVSDGHAMDRETVKLTVTSTRENLPPEFARLDDQVVQADSGYELQLEAADPNGDPVAFGVAGELPPGAELDPEIGLLRWQVPGALAGRTVTIAFTASDGELRAEMQVRFIVQRDGTGPSPPIFAPIGPFDAQVGVEIAFVLSAVDPDGTAVTYGLDGEAPPGSALDPATGSFRWTPTDAQAGQTVRVRFSASDGAFSAFLEVKITVLLPGPAAACEADPHEPNDSAPAAAPLGEGSARDLTICDQGDSAIDTDWFAIDVPAGKALEVLLTWPPDGQPLGVAIAVAGADGNAARFPAQGYGPRGDLLALYAPADGERLLVQVFGTEVARYAQAYDLTVRFPPAADACLPDDQEGPLGNDTSETPRFVELFAGAPVQLSGLTLCGDEADWYRLDLQCGHALDVRADFDPSLDVDMDLRLAADLSEVLRRAVSTVAPEHLSVDAIPLTGSWLLQVVTYPVEAVGRYSLELATSADPVCVGDDAEPDDGPGQATAISADGVISGRNLCCTEDWFSLRLEPGTRVTLLAEFRGGSGTLELLNGAGEVLAAEQGSEAEVEWRSVVAATVHARVRSASPLTTYELTSLFDTAPPACDHHACGDLEVCGDDGICVFDFCAGDDQCPREHRCIETYCVNPCEAHADCRAALGYRCKAFAQGRFCARAGEAAFGAACTGVDDCADDLVCLFTGAGGFCTRAGCDAQPDCPSGSPCADLDGLTFCGALCGGELGACREGSSLACRSLPIRGGGTSPVCAPEGVGP